MIACILRIPRKIYVDGFSNHDAEIWQYYMDNNVHPPSQSLNRYLGTYSDEKHVMWVIEPSTPLEQLDLLWYRAIHDGIPIWRRYYIGYEIVLGDQIIYSHEEWREHHKPRRS